MISLRRAVIHEPEAVGCGFGEVHIMGNQQDRAGEESARAPERGRDADVSGSKCFMRAA